MKDLLDVHTHTTASGHAYGTLTENIAAAKAKGLELVGISDHAPKMPGTSHEFYFLNFKVIPREIDGIKIVMGAELNIMDYSGSTDLPAQILKGLDYAIASLHNPCIDSGSVAENTAALIGVMKNPHVVIIGHPDNPYYPVDFDLLAKAAADNKVLTVPINLSATAQVRVIMQKLCLRLVKSTVLKSLWAVTLILILMSATTNFHKKFCLKIIFRLNLSSMTAQKNFSPA